MSSKRWQEVRDIRIIRACNKCEFCGDSFAPKDKIIGHHLLGREFQERYHLEDSEYCRVRHDYCEKDAHRFYPNGNLPSEQEIFSKVRSEYP